MGKTKTTPKEAPTSVAISYDLFDLPTAQHKAGLAGLILQIRSMKERKLKPELIPEITEFTATTTTIRFTETSTQALFDDFYDAEIVEVAVKAKWPGDPPRREEEVEEEDKETKKVKRSKRFIYDVVQPKGHFLKQHLPDGDGLWLKLWRNMLWEIPRSKPTTRGPFNSRADGKHCSEGPPAWSDLIGHVKARQKNSFRTDAISSALLLGAQAVNAEGVSFEGRVEQSLLLHFWPLTVLIFVPQQIDNDGEGAFVGFALAIPEVADLDSFCDDYPRLLHELPKEARGYRPAKAVIDIPAQSALEFLEDLRRLTQHSAEKSRLRASVSSIEYLHLVKAGNNVKSMASGRVAFDSRLLDKYLAIAGTGRPTFRNPIFRAGLLQSLLDNVEWYVSMTALLIERPWPFFVRSEKTPKALPWFAADAAAKFQILANDFEGERKIHAMTNSNASLLPKPQTPLDLLVYQLIRNFVNRKTEEKSGLKWENFKKTKDDETGKERMDVPQLYRDTREKIVADTFLAMRSRREQDFVDYFTSTICSVGQFLREDDFHVFAVALLQSPDEVKTLTMLALSANSY